MSDIIELNSSTGSVDSFAREEVWPDETNISEHIREQVYIKHIDGPIFLVLPLNFRKC